MFSENNNARKRGIFLHTKDRKDKANTTSSNFSISFDNTYNTKVVELKTASLIHSAYNVNSSNNNLHWVDTLSASHSSVITPGNYTASQLANAIATQMNADKSDAVVYASSIGTNSAKFVISIV